jgi:hypothetical protein
MQINRSLWIALLAAIFAIGCGASDPPETADDSTPVAQTNDVDDSTAPEGDDADPAQGVGPLGAAAFIRNDQLRTRHLRNGSVTAGKVAYVVSAVTVAMGAATGSSAADPTLAGGVLISCDPSSNQDQHMDNAVLNADGSVTITLAANATAANAFRCVSLKANAQGVP